MSDKRLGRDRARATVPVSSASHIMHELLDGVPASDIRKYAERAGIAYETVWRWRAGENSPTLYVFENLLEAMGKQLTLKSV